MTITPYRPSNGTEGADFFTGWCCRCARDRSMREGEPVEECDDDELCSIIAATFRYEIDDPNYPREWICGPNGPECTAFVSDGDAIPARCPHTIDMFAG